MTEIKSAIDFLTKETYCQFNKGDCDLDCGVCEYNTDSYGYDGDAKKAIYDTAIRSLSAWDKVLTELEETKSHATDLVKPKFLGKELKEITDMCFDEAIDIINQKLSEIEEVR